ncbi:receptor-like protein EIX2 [Andrographis paniculata]|uniref:receptor-like protein EIX2 n=1 Tax=Andrographis paniculata TaxID=175694 RepID=UPI0021E7A692|nr:receptor-like protein EIX2 [Andrographis paniculata]XP_051140098.1 receptor-like protein EIX2 [Andrographis paniculata]
MIAKLVMLLAVSLSLIGCDVMVVSGLVSCDAKEREALLALKQGLTDDYGVLSSWRGEECCSDWDGVECSNTTGRVVALRIFDINNDDGLRGDISPALLQLHNLTYLNLTGINFGGNPIPNFIASMKMLQNLTLSRCGLFGTVPPNLGNLTNLVQLDLSYNSLIVDSLDWLSELPSLSYLDLSGNNVSDANWPQRTLMLPSLKQLRLSNCQLSDDDRAYSLKEFSSTSLSTVDLSYNFLTLATLNWLSNIPSLVSIDVSRNQLDGVVPADFITNLTSLAKLDLSYNKLKAVVFGINPTTSNLVALDLSRNEIQQPLPELVDNLPCKTLEYLLLDFNQLSGSVPDFGSCLRIRELKLGNNKLERLPTSFARLLQLGRLDISNNSLEGNISTTTFMNLNNLTGIDLSFNEALYISPNWNPPPKMEGLLLRYVKIDPKFPSWVQGLTNLRGLDLSYNGISDVLPSWLWSFSTNFQMLFFSHNEFHGTIPNLSDKRLQIVDFSWNKFSGPLPQFHNDTNVLKLSHNELSGPIASICNLHTLRWLDLSYNQFSGEVPNCWENMTSNLIVLNLGNNNFSGEIPQSLGFLRGLQTLYLNGNSLSGELPWTLRNCTLVQLIDVGNNKLMGNIPKWIGESYRGVKYLMLGQNQFYGSIPQEVCYLTRIRVLDLSRNNLSGHVPTCVSNYSSLVEMNDDSAGDIFLNGIPNPVFSLGTNEGYTDYPYLLSRLGDRGYSDYAYVSVQWKTSESKYQKTLWLLKLIDLSDNQLSGSIPQQVFELKGLISLNLSKNALEGQIPPNIGDMEKLESLNLSRNQLSGAIPESLARLSFLQVLDLSHNNLSGRIPSSTQLQSFSESAYAENAQLCGRPLGLCPNLPTSQLDDDEERTSSSTVKDMFVSTAIGFVFGFCGLVAFFMLKRSWRIAYFNFLGVLGD